MSKIVLFEDYGYVNFLPLVWWRTVFELRLGRRILLDQSAQMLGLPVAGVWTRRSHATVASQRCGAPANVSVDKGMILVNGRWIPDGRVEFPEAPAVGIIDDVVVFVACDAKLAARLAPNDLLDAPRQKAALTGVKRVPAGGRLVDYPWDIVGRVADQLTSEWQEVEASIDTELDNRSALQGADKVHIGERCNIHPTALIDGTAGPVYISHDVRIGAYAIIEGPAYIGPGSRVNPHAWLHGGNSLGPVCKVGGEVSGCVIDGYTNKQHAGYLGRAYVGSWCNLGAGTSNSDLKNTYGPVRVPIVGKEVDTGRVLFGAIVGDHAKLGINTVIPTGAVVGFSVMAASGRVLPKYIPSFGWFTDAGLGRGDPARLLDAATVMMARREVDMTDDEVELFLELGEWVHEIEPGHPSRR